MAKSIIISGTRALKVGMVEALKEMGMRPNGSRTYDNIVSEGKSIVFKNTTPDEYYGSAHDESNGFYDSYQKFNLPQDWDKAIATIKAARKKEPVIIRLGSRNATVTISEKGAEARDSIFDLKAIEGYIHKLGITGNASSDYAMAVDLDSRFIRIGCKDENNLFSINEIRKVIDEAKKFNV